MMSYMNLKFYSSSKNTLPALNHVEGNVYRLRFYFTVY